jgi:hypothetical protein
MAVGFPLSHRAPQPERFPEPPTAGDRLYRFEALEIKASRLIVPASAVITSFVDFLILFVILASLEEMNEAAASGWAGLPATKLPTTHQ